MRIISYNRFDAVAYARRWAYARNPEFYDFSDLGGDCTNFASQCIYAGAKVMNFTPNTGWYYINANNRTPSWTGVEYLHEFLVNNIGIGPFAYEAEIEDVLPGDIVQLGRANGDFYHTLVITAVWPTIFVAAHSSNALNRPLYSYNFDIARFLHIDGVRV